MARRYKDAQRDEIHEVLDLLLGEWVDDGDCELLEELYLEGGAEPADKSYVEQVIAQAKKNRRWRKEAGQGRRGAPP